MKRLLVILVVGLFLLTGCATSAQETETSTMPLEVTQARLAECEDRLGEMNSIGEFYTLREFGYDIAKLTEPLPDIFISEAEGFSKLVLFYKDCETEWEEYNRLPVDMESTIALVAEELYGSDGYWLAGVLWSKYSELSSTPISVRTEYRLKHPEIDASLLFWGKSTKSVFYSGTEEAEEVSNLLLTWFNDYKIDRRMHPAFADWTLLPK